MAEETKTTLKARFVDNETVGKADLDAIIDSLNLGSVTHFVGLMNQTSSNDCTVTEISNTTGATLTTLFRAATGTYSGTFSSAVLVENKTVVLSALADAAGFMEVSPSGTSGIGVNTFNTSGTKADALLINAPLVILVFPA